MTSERDSSDTENKLLKNCDDLSFPIATYSIVRLLLSHKVYATNIIV